MIVLAIRRIRLHRNPLGKWSVSFWFAVCLTVEMMLGELVPNNIETERYWLGWLGNQVLRTHHVPRVLGSEAPLDQGRTWVAQEWLFGVLVAIMHNAHIFPIFAMLLGAGAATLIWIALAACIKGRIEPGITFLVLVTVALIINTRLGLRAEDMEFPLLALALTLSGTRKKGWVWLVPIVFMVWANVHGSFALGLLLCSILIIKNKKYKKLFIIGIAAIATLCNPAGIGLWEYVWWLPHSWVRQEIIEWQPTWENAPILIFALFLPIVLIPLRASWRKDAILNWAAWGLLTYLGIETTRLIGVAVAIGIPVGCAAIRVKKQLLPDFKNNNLAIIVSVLIVLRSHTMLLIEYPRLAIDPDFGLLISRDRNVWIVPKTGIEQTLTYCPDNASCSIVLFYGGKVVSDGRTDPFSPGRLETSAQDKRIEQIIAPGKLKVKGLNKNEWNVEKKGYYLIYRRK